MVRRSSETYSGGPKEATGALLILVGAMFVVTELGQNGVGRVGDGELWASTCSRGSQTAPRY